MTDRELLELAAKAAGIEGRYASLDEFPDWMTVHDGEGVYYTSRQAWNPLTDDGDALRLAVKLRMVVRLDGFNEDVVRVDYGSTQVPPPLPLYETSQGDKCAATRRAIVRAAAEIGRNMK